MKYWQVGVTRYLSRAYSFHCRIMYADPIKSEPPEVLKLPKSLRFKKFGSWKCQINHTDVDLEYATHPALNLLPSPAAPRHHYQKQLYFSCNALPEREIQPHLQDGHKVLFTRHIAKISYIHHQIMSVLFLFTRF